MATTEARIGGWDPPLWLHLPADLGLDDDRLFELCQLNPELRIERAADGTLTIMTPAGAQSSARNAEITRQLATWAAADGSGIAFDSSAGFRLPNGALRSPDASWVPKALLAQLPADALRRFPPLCPPFVVELRSPTDALDDLKEKLKEYLANGARLGWLIEADERRVYVYRRGQTAITLEEPETLDASPDLPGFSLSLASIW